jgi:hypothetical protein
MSSNTIDRRDSYRLHLDPGQATIRTAGDDGPDIELRDLSAGGGRWIVRTTAPELPLLPPVTIDLTGEHSLQAELDVVRVRSHERGVFHLGARWGALTPGGLHTLSSFIARECHRRASDPARLLDAARSLRVQSPVFIRNLLGPRHAADTQMLSIIDRNLRLGAQLRVDNMTFEAGRRVIRARFVGTEATQLLANRSYKFALNRAGAVTIFESRCLTQSGSDVTLTVPEEVRQSGSRESRRIDSAGIGAAVSVSLSQPRLGGANVTGVILDVSGRGLSFLVPALRHGLFPGDRIARLCVALPDGAITAQAVVRSVAPHSDAEASNGDGVACGVHLVGFANTENAARWRRFVFHCMHPNLIDGKHHATSALEVLESSNYLALWTSAESRTHVRDAYLKAWQGVHHDVGHCLLLQRQQSTDRLGVIAGSLAYPRSWILHHLARDGRADHGSETPLREACELISGILHRLKSETDLEHFVIYIERGKRWNERLYVDFAKQYFDHDKLLLSALEVYRRSTRLPLPPVSAAVEIAAATPATLAALATHLETVTAPLERRALALDHDQIGLADFHGLCADRGHERRRDVYLALVHGRAVAALIAETGSEGANLFGLLNACRIVTLVDAANQEAVDPDVHRALLHRAAEHYREAGKENFLLFESENADPAAPLSLGFAHISGGFRWIAHRDVIPPWAAYLEGLLAVTSQPASAGSGPRAPVPRPS